MKPIRLSKYFDKSYKKRIAPIENMRSAYMARVSAFQAGKRGQPLNDHALKGKLKGKRAFSIAGNVRVVYEETDEAIIFLDVGSHNQVYN
jgi:addiction module RelE/StbE family toxin